MPSLPRPRPHLACASVAAILALLPSAALHADEPVVWTNVVGASVSANSLTKTGTATTWDTGASSTNVIRDGYGYVEFTVPDLSHRVMAGLGNIDASVDYTDVDYGIHPAAGNFHVYEAGVYRGQFGSYSAGDRFRVEVQYGVVRYRRNGAVFYTSTVPPKYPLRADVSLFEPGTTISDVRIGHIAWAHEVGVAIAGSSLSKTGAAGWTSGAISANTIEGADGAMEFTATETNKTRVAGLSNGDSSQSWNDIDFGIEVRDDATTEVVEAGTSRGTFGAYGAGDRFRVEVRDGVVGYYRNGSSFYTSTVTPAYPLRIDTALYSASATLTDVGLTPLVWTGATGVTVADNSVAKTAAEGWNAGASSTRALTSGDGFVEFTASETNARRSVGLKESGTASSYADIDYAIDLGASGQLEVFELGVSRGQVGTYANGDRLRVEIQEGVVRYVKNGSLLYASTVAPTYPLHAEAQLYTSGATVKHLEMGDVVWINAVGVQAAANGLTKTATSTAWDAGAVSTRATNSGYVEATASERNSYRMIGLSHGNSSASYTDIDFAVYLVNDGTLHVYESGAYRGPVGTYAAGDRVRVALEAGVVKYYKNGTLLYTSAVSPELPLRIDSSFNTPGSSVLNVVLVGEAATDGPETPVMSPGTGTYTAAQTITITAGTGATIRYTIDGTDPSEASATYTGPIAIGQSTVVKAKAWKDGYQPSPVATATYELKVPAPGIAPGGGSYSTPQSVVISDSLAGSDIHYTTNGVDPTQGDTTIPSGNSVSISSPTTLKVAAWRSGWTRSDVVTASYAFQVATPTLTPVQGNYTGALPVTVATATPGATLHYRMDGGEPTAADPAVDSGTAVTVSHSATLKVVGFRAGWTDSATAAGTYWISLGSASTPSLSPPPGTFTSAQTVTISTTTSGAVIRYTTDGMDPGFQSPIYAGALTVGRTTVVKARAFAADMTKSPVAGGLYRVDTGTVDPPRFSPGGGQYPARQLVTVTSETPDAVIHYRLDGGDADELDPIVTSGSTILVGQNAHLRARAYKTGLPNSSVAAADYRITGAVALGSNFTFALKADGTVSSWGWNSFQALGDPAVANGDVRTTPGPVANLTDIVAVAGGANHGLALKNDGTAWAWGRNYVGQLGDGTATQRATPVQVANLSGVVAIAAAGDTSLALKNDGSVWIWGIDGTSIYPGNSYVPVQVGGLKGVTQISVGGANSAMAVQTDGMPSGTLWTWGNNSNGKLGDGTTTQRNSPVAVAQGVVTGAVGWLHAYALKEDGTVLAWGRNTSGQLGDGTTAEKYRPTAIPSLNGVVTIAAGMVSGMAVEADRTVWSWGANDYGPLGDGTFTTRTTPVQAWILQPLAVGSSNSDGSGHSASIHGDGTLWTWGKNDAGSLGDGTRTSNAFPKPVPNFSLTSNALWDVDTDGDGLSNVTEAQLGTDNRNADTNGDGVLDGAAVHAGLSPTNLDMDADGVSNVVEVARGTDPFLADTDGDGANDFSDCFPMDPSRWQCPASDPNDHTPPVISLQEPLPTAAELISSVPPQ
jgi:alpha-tubulin suppressor-like RCC1 family protein